MPQSDFSKIAVVVSGSRGNRYYVEIAGGSPISCTCPDYEYRRVHDGTMCKHMRTRSGKKAIGFTRCASCFYWLSPAEIDSQSDPEELLSRRGFARVCDACLRVRS